MVNTGEVALARVQTPNGRVSYDGMTEIAGVRGRHAAIPLLFQNTAGSMCGSLLPTGQEVDVIEGVAVTLIDNGMPCVIMRASDFDLSGAEAPEELEKNHRLRERVEAIRLHAGPMMNLADVKAASVPKMVLVSDPIAGGVLSTRSFIPHRVHTSIGVFAAITVATATRLPASPAYAPARQPFDGRYQIEHPTGSMEVFLDIDATGMQLGAGSVRTARKLLDGIVFPRPSR